MVVAPVAGVPSGEGTGLVEVAACEEQADSNTTRIRALRTMRVYGREAVISGAPNHVGYDQIA
jgi:hypothetical protein